MPTAGSIRERILMAIAGEDVGDLPTDAGNNIDNLLVRIAKGNANAAMIAPDYSALTFPVSSGTLCTHDGKLYAANQAISTSEEWTAAHWDETTVADNLGGGMHTETVTGSTPSITAEANKMYICGECSTLSVTPPESGIFGVIFESGSTPTVLTLDSDIIVPDWFDPDNLEADTIYELNVNENLLTVGMWGAS